MGATFPHGTGRDVNGLIDTITSTFGVNYFVFAIDQNYLGLVFIFLMDQDARLH